MSNIEHHNDAILADFMAGWRRITTDDTAGQHTTAFALIGLTNFGERPVLSTRLAEVLGLSVSEVEAGRGRVRLRQPRARTIGSPAAGPDR